MKCNSCGREASGKFCSNCGAALGGVACSTCGHTPPAGARFCNQCGGTLSASGGGQGSAAQQPTASAPAPRAPTPAQRKQPAKGDDNNTLWVVAGVILVGIILVALYPIFSPQDLNIGAPGTAATSTATGPSSVDLSQMTPREAADRLFDRVMRSVAAGDTAGAANFLPMAINAYDMARPLDLDGVHHVAMLKLEGGDNEGALAEALAGLEEYESHLFLLGAAAEASLALGDTAQAEAYYQRMLDAWDTELPSARPEYELHTNLQPILRQSAEDLLGG